MCLLCVIEGRGDVLPDPGMGTVAAYLIIAPFSAELAAQQLVRVAVG